METALRLTLKSEGDGVVLSRVGHGALVEVVFHLSDVVFVDFQGDGDELFSGGVGGLVHAGSGQGVQGSEAPRGKDLRRVKVPYSYTVLARADLGLNL